MIEIINDKVFHLMNNKMSYVLYVMKNNHLGHLYYGEPLGKLTDNDVKYLMERNNKSAGTVKFYDDDGMFTLSDRLQEYPVYGSSDFKEGAIEIYDNTTPLYLDFKFKKYEISNSKLRDESFPASYALDKESETLKISLVDSNHKIQLEMCYTIFNHSSVIAKSQEVHNNSDKTISIKKIHSGVLELNNSNYEFIHFSGAWLKERHIKKKTLTQGKVSVSSLKGATGHQHNPLVMLQEKSGNLNEGKVFASNLIYSGNFISQVEVDEWDNLRLMTGIHPDHFSWKLNKDESFKSPEAIIGYSNKGLNGISEELSCFIEDHIVDRKWKKKQRPIVFNNWEATYFDFTDKKLLALADKGKELGMECFVLDDGWFNNRNTDRTSLGDWTADHHKFPNGLSNFSKKIKEKDLDLGLWFEPEMVSLDTKLYNQHPEWVVGHPFERTSVGRGQYVLDFSNPEVVNHIYNQMKLIIEETNITYIKWDMNRNITEAYSYYLEQENIAQTEFFHRYISGVYQLYNKILRDFPYMFIEACAGGGGRYDLGILFYSPQIWPSDNSDAVERLAIMSGTLMGYPLSSFSNHVSASPNHQVYRETSIQMRQDVAIFGPLGYELDLEDLKENEKNKIMDYIEFYKTNRSLLTHGDFKQLIDPTEAGNEYSWGVFNTDRSEAIISFYRILTKPNSSVLEYLDIPFLSSNKKYEINGKEIVSGAILKKFGLRKPYQYNGANKNQAQLFGDFQSFIYHIKEVH